MKIKINQYYNEVLQELPDCYIFFCSMINKDYVVNRLLEIKPDCKIHGKLKWATIEKRFNAC